MSLNKSQALNAAKQYVLQRNLQAAVEIYRRIIEADPTDLTAITTLGDLYASTGRPQDAIAQFSRVAASYIEGGFARKAIATLNKIIAVDPANLETAIKLADMYAQAGLPSEARQHYLQITEALTRKGQTLDALSVYRKIVDLDPSNTSTRIKLGELYLREGMNEQAYEVFVTAADQLAAKSENRRALNAYNEALAIKPDSVEVLAAASKVLILLGVADPDKSLRSSASQPDVPGDLVKGHSPAPAASDPTGASTSLDQAPQSSDSFVVQEISKAERLVAYGQVNQAISMLRDVLRDKPDSIDVHFKLKDIYLRTGMMKEAAQECVELERIHDARGESERARDYAVRAIRLTQLLEQPSGDLPEPARKPVDEVEPRVYAAPAKVASQHDAALKPRPVARRFDAPPDHLSRMTIAVVPSEAPAVEPAMLPALNLRPASQLSSVEALAPVPEAEIDGAPSRGTAFPLSSSVEALARVAEAEIDGAPSRGTALALSSSVEALARLAEAEIDGAPSRETALALSTRPSADASARVLPALFAGSLRVKKKRIRLTAAAIAAAVFVLLGASAVIGGFAYDAHLDKQYQALAMAAAPLELPSPPPILVTDEPPPLKENEPMTVVVTPPVQTGASAQEQSAGPEAISKEPSSPPQPANEPPKAAPKPSPLLPRTAVGFDNPAGTENRTPVGVPVDVPFGATHPAEPPPRAVRQSPGVVLGSAVKKVEPVYPAAARDARQGGVVTVEVTISEHGNVTSARALAGPALLRNAAVLAARAWTFKASTLGGVPVTTVTTIVFNFKL